MTNELAPRPAIEMWASDFLHRGGQNWRSAFTVRTYLNTVSSVTSSALSVYIEGQQHPNLSHLGQKLHWLLDLER